MISVPGAAMNTTRRDSVRAGQALFRSFVTIFLRRVFRQNLQNRQTHFFISDNSVHSVLILSARLLTYSSPRSRRRGEQIRVNSFILACDLSHVARLRRRRSPRRPKAGHHSLKTGLWTEFTESAESFL